MGRGFGDTLDRLLRNGVGVHHAGMLPRTAGWSNAWRARACCPVICGTDTLGVGVNIPIRTVLMTALTKFDGSRVRIFTAREFHQLAGRAGRPGFDPDGHVWVQAPDHVIENAKALAERATIRRPAARPPRPRPPTASCTTTRPRCTASSPHRPEPLVSRFRVTADLVASVLARPDGPAR
jgi:hypothetical protein